MTSTHQLPLQHCPVCRYEITAASNFETGAGPAPRDLTVCIECAAVLEFTEDLRLRALTEEEVAALRGTDKRWPDVVQKRQTILALHRRG